MRWKKKKFTARTVAAGLLFLTAALASPAGAAVDTPYKSSDPQDAPARADIVKYKVRNIGTLRLDVWLRKGTNPHTHKAWTKGDSSILWNIDDDGDKVGDFIAGMRNNGNLVGVVVVDGGPPTILCPVTAFFNGANRYRLEFQSSCVGSTADGVRVRPFATFDRKPYEIGLGLPINDAFDVAKYSPVLKYTLS